MNTCKDNNLKICTFKIHAHSYDGDKKEYIEVLCKLERIIEKYE